MSRSGALTLPWQDSEAGTKLRGVPPNLRVVLQTPVRRSQGAFSQTTGTEEDSQVMQTVLGKSVEAALSWVPSALLEWLPCSQDSALLLSWLGGLSLPRHLGGVP